MNEIENYLLSRKINTHNMVLESTIKCQKKKKKKRERERVKLPFT